MFASWDAFSFISSKRADALFVNAGYSAPSWAKQPARVSELGRMQFEARSPWDEERHDLFTFEMAFDYLKSVRPRVMYIAFDETDDWAHDRRYDRVLESLQYFDHCLERVWTWVQNSPEYRGNTTLILTTDHGRGKTLSDWHSHGEKVPDSKEIWAAVIGPDTPEGGVVRGGAENHQRDIAPTMLKLMGIDPREYEGVEGTAIALALPAAERYERSVRRRRGCGRRSAKERRSSTRRPWYLYVARVDGRLDDGKPGGAGDVKILDIEAEAVQALAGEDLAGGGGVVVA